MYLSKTEFTHNPRKHYGTMPIRISTDRVDMDDKELQRPVIRDFAETVMISDSGSSYTIDLAELPVVSS